MSCTDAWSDEGEVSAQPPCLIYSSIPSRAGEQTAGISHLGQDINAGSKGNAATQ